MTWPDGSSGSKVIYICPTHGRQELANRVKIGEAHIGCLRCRESEERDQACVRVPVIPLAQHEEVQRELNVSRTNEEYTNGRFEDEAERRECAETERDAARALLGELADARREANEAEAKLATLRAGVEAEIQSCMEEAKDCRREAAEHNEVSTKASAYNIVANSLSTLLSDLTEVSK